MPNNAAQDFGGYSIVFYVSPNLFAIASGLLILFLFTPRVTTRFLIELLETKMSEAQHM
jgi:hypothetical protein